MASASSDVRKRPINHISDHDNGPRKRLQPDVGAGGDDDAGEDESENLWPKYKELEAFRKEAIYRQLLESRRKLSRTGRRLREAEHELDRAERSSALLRRFWDLLLERAITRLPAEKRGSLSSLDAQIGADALETALEDRLSAFAPLLSSGFDAPHDVAQLQRRCDELAEDAATRKQDLLLAQSRLGRSEKALRESNAKLTKLERDFVRGQSDVVRTTEGRKSPTAEDAPPAPAPATPAESEKPQSSSRASPTTQTDTHALMELQDQLAKARDSLAVAEKESDGRFVEIQSLNDEIKALKLEVHQLKAQANEIPDERFEASAVCKTLHARLSQVQQELKDAEERRQDVEAENAALREESANLAKAIEVELNDRIEGLEKTVKTRDSDVTRLRRQRDELQAELTERRQREQVKFSQIEEMKALVTVKEERLAVLTNYIRRLRLTIAASRGEAAAVEVLSAEADEGEQLAKLAEAARAAEAEAECLRRKLSDLGHSEANGSGAEAGADQPAASLEDEVERLQLELRTAAASSTALCDEIDRFSSAYSELEKKAGNHVMDLSKMENKMLRLVTEKSKADQKFFATMRVKESLEAENRAALRNVERQTKLIELLTESEKTFAAQLQAHERESTVFKRTVEDHTKKITGLEAELDSARARLAEASRIKSDVEVSAKELINAATDEKNARKRTEENIARLEKDLQQAQRQAARAAASGAGKMGRKAGDASAEETNMAATKLMQCSTCHEGWRNVIITKCFHTFCKSCIESRIQTRQRKCPHCAIPFAVSDVQALYLQ